MSPQLTPLAPLALAALLAACGGHTQAERVPAVPGGDPRLGRAALAEWGCGGCHVIPGVTAAVGRVGPPLTDFAERAFVAGRLPNEPASLVRWILDPQGVSPGTAMPDLGVSEEAASHMAAYLYTLAGDRLGPPHLIPPTVVDRH